MTVGARPPRGRDASRRALELARVARRAARSASRAGARLVTLYGRPRRRATSSSPRCSQDGARPAACSRTRVDAGARLPRADRRAPGAALLRARAPRAARRPHRGPPVAQADPLRGQRPGRDERLSVLPDRRQGGARGRGRPDPRRRDRARLASASCASASRCTTSRSTSATSTAASRRGCSSAIRARSRRWSRPSRATRASPTPGPTAPRSRRSRGDRARPEVELARGVALELERIAMHLAGLAGLAADIGFLPGRHDLRPAAHHRHQHLDAPVRQPLRPRRAAPGRHAACALDAELAASSCARTCALLAQRPRDHQRLLPVGAHGPAPARRASACVTATQAARARPRRHGRARVAASPIDARAGAGGALRARTRSRPCVEPTATAGRARGCASREIDASLAWLGARRSTRARAGQPHARAARRRSRRRSSSSRSSRAGAARSCTASRPDARRRAAPLQGAGPVAAQLDGPRARGARQRDLRLPDLQQELRPLLLRERPLSIVQVAARARSRRASSTSPTCARPCPTGFRGLPAHRGDALRRRAAAPAATSARPARSRSSPLALDLGRCVFCSECVEACPEDKIAFTPEPRMGARHARRRSSSREGEPRSTPIRAVARASRSSSAARSSCGRSRPAAATAASSSSTRSPTSTSTSSATASSGSPRRATPTRSC